MTLITGYNTCRWRSPVGSGVSSCHPQHFGGVGPAHVGRKAHRLQYCSAEAAFSTLALPEEMQVEA